MDAGLGLEYRVSHGWWFSTPPKEPWEPFGASKYSPGP
jgi:hypothetical protein